ncbi:hypothetical protein CC80DRAFT_496589 [Byssothecium circinans]|uniref:Uncharacterized protein n=1 Tax=Byssothecium circinans TaxID=147558 RepID=A0A6A5TEB7_9PLEO|nr:hypothetical protein CC80DRAFT_496589 [Byssothecium circinans]
MCLVKVRQEEDVVVPYRVVHRDHSPRRRSHQSIRRVSRTEVVHESPRHSASYVAVPSPGPAPLAIPPPQPVPVFYEPPPAPIPPPSVSHHSHHSHHGGERAHYVEVSPASSVTSHSPSRASEYVVHEREYRRQRRERDYSPEERSPRYEHFRYVEGPGNESDYGGRERYERRSRSRVRERSVSRGRYDEPAERFTRERVSVHVGDGRRSRDYRVV